MPDFDGFWTWEAWFEMGVVEINGLRYRGLRMGLGLLVDGSSHGWAEIWERSSVGGTCVVAVGGDHLRRYTAARVFP